MTKLLTTIALIGVSIVPIFQDTGITHLLNPVWDAHARTHLVWMMASNFLFFLLAIYVLWFKNMELLAALLSLCMLIGYDISAVTMPLYEGVPLGEGGVEPKPFGIPINLLYNYFVGDPEQAYATMKPMLDLLKKQEKNSE